MNQRIMEFETMWAAVRVLAPAVLVRTTATPELDMDADLFVPAPYTRQTNEHELLPPEMREQWWSASTKVEKDDIMMQYEAMFW